MTGPVFASPRNANPGRQWYVACKVLPYTSNVKLAWSVLGGSPQVFSEKKTVNKQNVNVKLQNNNQVKCPETVDRNKGNLKSKEDK